MAGRGVKLAEEVKADLVHHLVLMDVQVNDEMKLFSPISKQRYSHDHPDIRKMQLWILRFFFQERNYEINIIKQIKS